MSRRSNVSGFKKMYDTFTVDNMIVGVNKITSDTRNMAKFHIIHFLLSDTLVTNISNSIQSASERISGTHAFPMGNSFRAEEIVESFTDKLRSHESIYGYVLLRL
jgi:hypothetical protein